VEEKRRVHAGAIEQAHGAGIGVWQDGFGSVFGGDLFEIRGDGVEGGVPGDGFELAGALRAGATEGCEEARGVVDAIEVVGDLGAEEALGDGVVGIALDFCCAVGGGVDGDENGAGVGAVESAGGKAMDGGWRQLWARLPRLYGGVAGSTGEEFHDT